MTNRVHVGVDPVRRNRVKMMGEGPRTLVFSNGFGCDQQTWHRVAPAFYDECRVVTFDFIGLGETNSSHFDQARYDTYHGYAQDLLEVCDALSLHNSIFVGHSASSMIGLLASIAEPTRFSKLIMVGPSPCYLNMPDYKGGLDRSAIDQILSAIDGDFKGWTNQMAPLLMGNPARPELGRELTEIFHRADPKFAASFSKTVFLSDYREQLKKCTTESVILQCSEDLVAPQSVGKYLATQLPNSRFHQLKALGHYPQLSAPEELIDVIRTAIGHKN